MTKDTLAKLRMIEKQMEAAIEKETNANVEVTIRDTVMVYTEDMHRHLAIKGLMTQARDLLRVETYEKDHHYPAGMTMHFSLDRVTLPIGSSI